MARDSPCHSPGRKIRPFSEEIYCTLVQWRSRYDAPQNVVANGDEVVRAALRHSWYRELRKKTTVTVVVVEDDASIRGALRRQPQILGFNVRDFQGAEEFLASEFPTGNACLLLDVYMPGMSGIELCRTLAASGRQVPTILMSGREDEQTRQMMSDANPIAILIKPFDENNLLRAISRVRVSG
jgi:CheY-like chemotaxis protein